MLLSGLVFLGMVFLGMAWRWFVLGLAVGVVIGASIKVFYFFIRGNGIIELSLKIFSSA